MKKHIINIILLTLLLSIVNIHPYLNIKLQMYKATITDLGIDIGSTQFYQLKGYGVRDMNLTLREVYPELTPYLTDKGDHFEVTFLTYIDDPTLKIGDNVLCKNYKIKPFDILYQRFDGSTFTCFKDRTGGK